MMMEVEGAESDFEALDSDEAPAPSKKKTSKAGTSKKTVTQPKKVTAAKSRGKAKTKVLVSLHKQVIVGFSWLIQFP
jgi:hypothetical protein